jgi:hypothetical protein
MKLGFVAASMSLHRTSLWYQISLIPIGIFLYRLVEALSKA